MTVSYIRWRDASHNMAEVEISEMNLCTLHEVGFLVDETDEKVTLAIEAPLDDGTTTRLWLSIPKVGILERRDMELSKAFPARRIRRAPAAG